MDSILKGIINSHYPEAFKKQLIEKCFIRGASDQNAAKECQVVLAASCDLALNAESEFSVNIGLQVYDVWAKEHENHLSEFFTPSYLINLLTDNTIKNKAKIFHIVTTSLKILKTKASFPQLCRIIQTRCISFLQENGDLPVLTAVVPVLHEFHQCLPVGEFSATFCAVLVRCLASVTPPATASELPYFLGVSSVCNLLQTLWSINESCVQRTLKSLYVVLSSDEVSCSPAIAPIVDRLPLELVDSVTKILMQDKSSSERSLMIAVARMLDWVTWPGTSNIDNWLVAILQGLANEKMYTLLVTVFEAKIEQVFSFLFYPLTRKTVLPVLSCMLLSYQHSPRLFHSIAGKVPELISHLDAEHSNHSKDVFDKLSGLLHTLMYLHTGFPELYDPIMEALKDTNPPSLEEMQQWLTEHRWGNPQKKYTNETSGYLGTVRSETGLTGLVNLGNTCYMNSVLQALYITESLKWKVLQCSPSPKEVLLKNLQEVFAYLTLTQRPAYAPQDFLCISRPPWFEDREQQDCSEFLRFLLDRIDEQQEESKRADGSSNKKHCASSEIEKGECSMSDRVEPSSSLKKCQKGYGGQLLQEVFGGTMQTSYKCLKCEHCSVHQDTFTDIHLAFPQSHVKGGQDTSSCADQCGVTSQSSKTKAGSEKIVHNSLKSTLSLEDLIFNYFCPETLDGDNKYFCEICKSLQAAQRLVLVLKPPEHLILTLLRFSYSAATNSRVKVITEISYPLVLKLPYRDSNEKNSNKLTEAIYCLYAVIVHSGNSAECGHYYTYARSSLICSPLSTPGTSTDSNNDKIDLLSDKWYLFNDSRVSFSSYDFFRNLTERFPKDTAYMLFYRRLPSPVEEVFQDEPFQHTVIKKELRETVAKDNTKYLQEQELESRAQRKKTLFIGSKHPHQDFDDSFPPTGGCGSSMGGGMDSSLTRFVF